VRRKFRLNQEKDIKRVRRYGRSYADPLFTLIACKNEIQLTRIGIISSKSLGNAVKRNRARRRLRAGSDELFSKILPGWDVILVANKAIVEVRFTEILKQ